VQRISQGAGVVVGTVVVVVVVVATVVATVVVVGATVVVTVVVGATVVVVAGVVVVGAVVVALVATVVVATNATPLGNVSGIVTPNETTTTATNAKNTNPSLTFMYPSSSTLGGSKRSPAADMFFTPRGLVGGAEIILTFG